eukprot:scaffold1687_cov405-Prasinococcus_capsulatus_cf.AAC.24
MHVMYRAQDSRSAAAIACVVAGAPARRACPCRAVLPITGRRLATAVTNLGSATLGEGGSAASAAAAAVDVARGKLSLREPSSADDGADDDSSGPVALPAAASGALRRRLQPRRTGQRRHACRPPDTRGGGCAPRGAHAEEHAGT